MKTWLLYPPFADPTQPYLSLPYLKGSLRARGLDATVVDLNVAAARYLLDREYLAEITERLAARFARLDARRDLTRLEQMEYLALADARPAARRLLAAETLPVAIFRDSDRFYDFATYRQARDLAEAALECISAVHFPFRYHFNQAAHIALPWHPALLESYFQSCQSPLDAFYRDHFARNPMGAGDLVGINLTFISQIPEAFYLTQLMRRIEPSIFIVLGGSCLQQMLAHSDEAAQHWIVGVADAACRFEGEETLPLLLAALADGAAAQDPDQRFQGLAQVPNLLIRSPEGALHAGPLHVCDLKQAAMPDFDDLDLDGYLAPEHTLLFAPTRGCYWNRCAFCDYGANRLGCHGYREMAAETAAEQLVALAERHAVRNFYLSVDVMAPRFAEALAQALVKRRAAIRWSADFRIEKYYSAECCALLHQSGLRAVAFGVESGSDRTLAAMDKGISVALIRTVNARFHQAGIATAWMAFSGHPGEANAAALETARIIEKERAAIDLFILGQFGLTSGSRIAADARTYGLSRIFYCRGDAFRLFPLYETEQVASTRGAQQMERAVARLSRLYFLDHYPWAGAISTHHSFLYFLRFGPDIFKKLAAAPPPEPRSPSRRNTTHPPALSQRTRFSLARLRDDQQRWIERFWRQALAPGADGTAPLDEAYFQEYFGAAGEA
jgi:anaerobic magnesium-protoporphyrin IX monomethyl ester cyclase